MHPGYPQSKLWPTTTNLTAAAASSTAPPSIASSTSPFIVGVDSDSLFLSPPNSSLPWSVATAAAAATGKRHSVPRRISSGLFPAGWQSQQYSPSHYSSLYSPAVAAPAFDPDFYTQPLTRSLTEAAGRTGSQQQQPSAPTQEQYSTANKPQRIPLKRRHSSQYEDIRAAAGSRSSFSSVSSAASSSTAASSSQQQQQQQRLSARDHRQAPIAGFADSDDLLFAEPGPVDFDDFDIFPGTSAPTRHRPSHNSLIASPDRMDVTLSRPPSPSTVNKELGVLGNSNTSASSTTAANGLAVPQISTAGGNDFFLDNSKAENNIKQEPSAHAQGLSDSACAYDLRDHQEPPTVKKEYPPDDDDLHKTQLEKINNGEDPLKNQLDIEPGPVCFPPTTPIISEPTEPSEFAPAVGVSQAKGVGDYAKSPLLSSSVPPSLAVEEEQRYRDGRSTSAAPDLPPPASLLPPLPQPSLSNVQKPMTNGSPTNYFEQSLDKGDIPNISRPGNRAGQPSFLKNTGDGVIRTPGPAQMVSPKEAFKDYTNVTGIKEEPKVGAAMTSSNGGSASYNALMQALGNSQQMQKNLSTASSLHSNLGDVKPIQALPPMPPQPQAQSNLPPPPAYAMFAGYQPAPQQQAAPSLPSTLNYQSAPAPLAFHDGGFFSNQAMLASMAAAEQNAKNAATAAAAPSIASNHPFAQHFPPQQQQQQYQAQQHAAAAAQLPLPNLANYPYSNPSSANAYGYLPLATTDLVSQHFGPPGSNGPADVPVTSGRKRGRPKGSLNGTLRRTSSGGKGSRSNIRGTNAGTDDTSEDDYGVGRSESVQSSSGRPIRAKAGDRSQRQDDQSKLTMSSSYYSDPNQSLASDYAYNNGHASSDAAAAAAAAPALAGERAPDEGLGSIQDEDSASDEEGDEWVAEDSDDSFGKPAKKKPKRTTASSASINIPNLAGGSSNSSLQQPGQARSARNGPAGSVAGLDADGNPISESSPGSTGTGHGHGRSRQQAPPGTGNILCDYVDAKTGVRCPVKFRRPYDQARHMETVHNAAVEKVKWSCGTCKKQFSRKDALIRHGRISAHPT